MNHKTDEDWGILLLEMAHDAREGGDRGTADLLRAAAMRYFDEADRLQRVGEISKQTSIIAR